MKPGAVMPTVAVGEEQMRLEALLRLDLLDTPPEPEFDELVEFAAALCGVPVGLVTLLDAKRQWFKAAYGVSVRETAREVSFCNHTIQQTDVMLVPDATRDPRFVDNPDVTGGPCYRFYAGVPILSPDGYRLGSLCVLDYIPKSLDGAQVMALRVLGRQVNARLQLREQRITLARNLEKLAEANAKLKTLATTDALTGVANRRSFEERLTAEFRRARRKGRPLCVMMIDIDNFKQLNDQLGHEVGDTCLRTIAGLLVGLLRERDIVARYGGEEFVVLLPDTGELQALQLAERMLEAVRAHPWQHLRKTVSCGVAALTDATVNAQKLVRQADEALYCAKHLGKDRVRSASTLHADAA